MTRHDEKVRRIVEQVKARLEWNQPVDFAKESVSHFVPNPHDIRLPPAAVIGRQNQAEES